MLLPDEQDFAEQCREKALYQDAYEAYVPTLISRLDALREELAALKEQNKTLVEALNKIKNLSTTGSWNEGQFYEDGRQSGYKKAARIASDALAAAKD